MAGYRMGYVISQRYVIDTAGCKDFVLFPRRSLVWVIVAISGYGGGTVNIVMEVLQDLCWSSWEGHSGTTRLPCNDIHKHALK